MLRSYNQRREQQFANEQRADVCQEDQQGGARRGEDDQGQTRRDSVVVTYAQS